jgi:deoxyribodipyrimidine photo-lyase
MMQQENTVIHWFRQDLRLTDNPALFEATQEQKVLPIYILDDINSKEHMMQVILKKCLMN